MRKGRICASFAMPPTLDVIAENFFPPSRRKKKEKISIPNVRGCLSAGHSCAPPRQLPSMSGEIIDITVSLARQTSSSAGTRNGVHRGPRALVADRIDTQFAGSPGQVADKLEQLRDATEADELIITTVTHDHADRVRSYRLLAEEWARR
jgi:alkanesulfonate monooxygenase SsuD/methylene tetrahydromethanopterin reductase-like flavin-dependent oxidoreductase (luciferase family)